MYTQGNGEKWDRDDMLSVMLEISRTSLQVLASDLFKKLTKKQ
ncbi:MAG: hypothetical protein KBT67_04940 [bacterium]|nr:hypothetical protein [Candidatus Limimorpha caballi]